MNLLEFFHISRFGWTDAVDILLVSLVIYQVLVLIRGTRAAQMALGISFIVLFYYVSRRWHLETVQWLLTNLLPYFFLALIIIFQSEIRRALATIGKNPFWRSLSAVRWSDVYDEIALTAATLSAQRLGGLIVIERDIGLKTYIESGIAMNAQVSYDLLVTIFNPRAPLHDGAVIIQKDKIAAAACFLPLTIEPRLSKELGTRHRAAIGITEETDAVAVVISEETGKIGLAHRGQLERGFDADLLRERLDELFQTGAASPGSVHAAQPSSAAESASLAECETSAAPLSPATERATSPRKEPSR